MKFSVFSESNGSNKKNGNCLKKKTSPAAGQLATSCACLYWTTSPLNYLQSGASSQAKHGGAYFSAVYGSIEDPLAAPGPYENLGPPFLGGSAQPVTFVLPLTHAHTASAPQRALQQDLFWNRSNVFVTKQIHETCFRTNPAGMPIDER